MIYIHSSLELFEVKMIRKTAVLPDGKYILNRKHRNNI